tara:strand:- start:519 stop:935 length:417 start_codon:yes stop_codon:yes gene_type:complete
METRQIMFLLAVKKYWELTASFLRNHWRAVVVLGAMAVCYLYGKNVQKKLKLDHALAKAQWRKEREQIENSYQSEIEKRQKASKAYEVAIKAAEEKKAKSITDLEKKKVEETKKIIKASKNDPEKLDKILKDLGIEEL